MLDLLEIHSPSLITE
jgi:hypothetical protein